MTHWHVHRSAINRYDSDSSYTDNFDRVRKFINETDPVVFRRITISEPAYCDRDHVDYWIDLDANQDYTGRRNEGGEMNETSSSDSGE